MLFPADHMVHLQRHARSKNGFLRHIQPVPPVRDQPQLLQQLPGGLPLNLNGNRGPVVEDLNSGVPVDRNGLLLPAVGGDGA